MTPSHRLQSYYGYAFESWCTSDSPSPQASHPTKPNPTRSLPNRPTTNIPEVQTQPPNGWGGDVDTTVQWCCVVKTKLGRTRMILGGEVDCVRG